MRYPRPRRGLYAFLVTFPERVYPFSARINGERVRWRRSYEYALARIQRRYGQGRYGLRLGAYRQLCHIIGAALFIALATWLSHSLIGSQAALPVMFGAALIAITYQEFYYHPRHYNQRWVKSIVDWMSWVVPISAYLFYVVL